MSLRSSQSNANYFRRNAKLLSSFSLSLLLLLSLFTLGANHYTFKCKIYNREDRAMFYVLRHIANLYMHSDTSFYLFRCRDVENKKLRYI